MEHRLHLWIRGAPCRDCKKQWQEWDENDGYADDIDDYTKEVADSIDLVRCCDLLP